MVRYYKNIIEEIIKENVKIRDNCLGNHRYKIIKPKEYFYYLGRFIDIVNQEFKIRPEFYNFYQYASPYDTDGKNELYTKKYNEVNHNVFFIWRRDYNQLTNYVISLRGLIKYELPLELIWGITTKDINYKIYKELNNIGVFIIYKNYKYLSINNKGTIEKLKKSLEAINNVDNVINQLKNHYFIKNKMSLDDNDSVKKYLNYLNWIKLASKYSNTVIHIPFSIIPEDRRMGLVFGINIEKWNTEVVKYIKIIYYGCIAVSKLNIELEIQQHKDKVLYHGLRTAVASIMARNMSHNIGSHVLSNLSSPEDIKKILVAKK